ncbi:MAG: methyltransferase domain-containing protein [Bacteroidales bacterium]|nr:methyltransferase domain-containing protein [Bacteroidales bacterium]
MDLKEFQHSSFTSRHPWELARFEVMKDILSRRIDFDSVRMVADIGCGDAFVVDNLAAFMPKANLAAVDKNFTAVEKEQILASIRHSNITLFEDVLELESLQQNIDIVLLMDVIEHVEKDVDFIRQVKTLPNVTSNTLFFVTVPAFQSLFSEHDVFLNHFRRYNQSQLQEVLMQAGLKVNQTGYFFLSLLFVRSLQKMLRKDNTNGLNQSKSSAFANRIVKMVLLIDYNISSFLNKIGIRLPGLSLYALCQKSAS